MTSSMINHKTSLETLSSTLFLSLDEVHFFNSINAFFKNHMNAQKVMVYKILDNGQSVLMSEDGEPALHGHILEKGVGAAGYIARTKRGYFSNTVERDPVFTREAGLGVKAELCLPISADGVVIGSIHCQMFDSSREFSREDMTAGMSILADIKQPIQNMKMYLAAKNLNEALLRTIELKEKELQESRSGVKIQDSFKILEKEIIGRSQAMKDLLALVDRIADKEISAFIIGEAATGKEMIARRIHCRSHRRDRAFVTIDCSTMNEAQLDREMFGLENHMGMLEVSNFGTLFINSIEKMTPGVQNKLVQFITNKMGVKADNGFFKSDVRLISASTKDLMELVREGRFREDLYFALSTVVLKAPALRERKEDIELMANFFLNQNKAKEAQKSFSPGAIKALTEFNWSGNVRELQNVVERAFILAEGSVIEKLHLDQNIQTASEIKVEAQAPVAAKPVEFQHVTLEELEKNHIMGTLENLGGNKTKTAKVLGITVKTLYNKLHSYGVEFDKEA